MLCAIGTALLFTSCGASQQLIVESPAIPGIELAGPQSPGFEALVTGIIGPERPAALTAALPYGVVIRNRTSQAIAAIDTVWTASARILLNAADQMFGEPVLYVKPGQAVLAVPPGILENPRQLRIFANGAMAGHRMENFDHPGEVTVEVDAVVFESGQFAGADRYGVFARWEAEIQAPRDLAASVLRKRKTATPGDIAVWLEGLAAVRRLPADPHAQETIGAARLLLAVYRSKGVAELYSRAKSMLDAPAFPLHR